MRPVVLPAADNGGRPFEVPNLWLVSAQELERYLRERGKRE